MDKVKVTDLHPVSLGSTLAGTHVSHWWRQEGHPDKTANVHQNKSYLRRHVRALRPSGHDTVMEHHYRNVTVKLLCSSKY